MSVARVHQTEALPGSDDRLNQEASIDAVSLLGAAWDLGAPAYGSSTAAETFFKNSRCQRHYWEKIGNRQGFIRGAHSLNCDTVIPHVIPLCLQLAKRIGQSLKQEQKFAVIGGDHSCAIGTWHGVRHALDKDEDFGLICGINGVRLELIADS